jgi:DNA-binding beta-propeller fold protein YncE
LIRVSNNHSHSRTTLASDGLFQPTGVAVNSNGTIYVANHGESAGSATPSGDIVRIN